MFSLPAIAGLDPMLFLGLPLGFFGETTMPDRSFSESSSLPLSVVFRRPVAFGFGVPFLFTGSSKDFRGLPLPRLAAGEFESVAPFKGTVVVIVFSTRRFEGESAMVFSGSASTVTRIRHGLVTHCDLALDFVGDEEDCLRVGGVVR